MSEAVHPEVPGAAPARDETGRGGPALRERPVERPQPGFKLARIAGVEIRVDWSLAIIFWLIAFNLGAGLFPARHPDWNPAFAWTLAIVTAAVFFASVLAHELAHAIVARKRGLPVHTITLFMFGGVAHLSDEPREPRTELLIAIVGPVTSFAIGFICLAIGLGLSGLTAETAPTAEAISRMSPAVTVLLWLGSINILLAIFNLLPGFPLDGGRVLRAALWSITGDLKKATHGASLIGRFFAFLLIIAGVSMAFGARLPILGTGLFSGLWLVLIGWFLNNAAIMSYQQVVVTEALGGLPVARLLRADVRAVSELTRVSDVVDLFMETDQQSFPVIEDGRFSGLVSIVDLRRVPRERWDTTPVRAIMRRADELESAPPDESAADALKKLLSQNVDQLPVIDKDGRLLGMVRRTDLLRWIELHGGR